MSGSPMPYIKAYTEALDDNKLMRLPDSAQLRFWQLCLYAGECDQEGYLVAGGNPLTVDDMAWRLRIDASRLEADLSILNNAGLVVWDEGAWFVAKFAERQGRPQSEKRQIWRDRQRQRREQQEQRAPAQAPEAPPAWLEDTEEELPFTDDLLPEDEDECPASVTRDTTETLPNVPKMSKPIEEKSREEKKQRANARTGTTDGLSPGQSQFLALFGAQRFKNTVQRETVGTLAETYGAEALLGAGRWAALKGMNLGDGIAAVQKALPKWDHAPAPPGTNGHANPEAVVKGL